MLDKELTGYSRYYKLLKKRGSLKLRTIWYPYWRWYNKTFNFEGAVALDFGSSISSNFFAKYQRNNHNDMRGYKGYDIDQDTVEWLKNTGFYYDFYHDDSLVGKFDLINASQVYEHLDEKEREEFIKRAYKLLKLNGLLLLDIPHIANLNIIEFFRADRTHKPVGREEEAEYIQLFGFDCSIYLCGFTQPYRTVLWNIWNFLRNLFLGYYPFNVVLIVAKKIS